MTKKIIKWYHKMNTWQFVGYVVTPIAVTGEGAILGLNLNPAYHGIIFMAVVVSGAVKYFAKDANNNNIVDHFENESK